MTYPITERTYFSSQQVAWNFAQAISKLNHHVVSNYGVDDSHTDEPFFVETMNDPFSTKQELLAKIGRR